uniref:Uncharacterized protein n=1 Tax=Terrapene triunguis TaxID=2587831 RepID=A0A674I9L7_9SAUR
MNGVVSQIPQQARLCPQLHLAQGTSLSSPSCTMLRRKPCVGGAALELPGRHCYNASRRLPESPCSGCSAAGDRTRRIQGVPRPAQRLRQTHSPSAMAGEPQQPQPSPDEECAQEEDDQSHNARGIPPLSHLPVSHEASGAVPHQERGVTAHTRALDWRTPHTHWAGLDLGMHHTAQPVSL